MPWVCQQFVIVVFPDHIHLLFLHVNNHTFYSELHLLLKYTYFVIKIMHSKSFIVTSEVVNRLQKKKCRPLIVCQSI